MVRGAIGRVLRFLGKEGLRGLAWEFAVAVWRRVEDHAGWAVACVVGWIGVIAGLPAWVLMVIVIAVGLGVSVAMSSVVTRRERERVEHDRDAILAVFAEAFAAEVRPMTDMIVETVVEQLWARLRTDRSDP